MLQKLNISQFKTFAKQVYASTIIIYAGIGTYSSAKTANNLQLSFKDSCCVVSVGFAAGTILGLFMPILFPFSLSTGNYIKIKWSINGNTFTLTSGQNQYTLYTLDINDDKQN